MTVNPLTGFESLETHHCITGSMRHVYHFNHHPISEELLLGLGEGVSFIYWHPKGGQPFMGGRNNPKPGLEEIAGQHTGVVIKAHTSANPRKATQAMLSLLENGQPVMVMVDMGLLPYFDFGGTEYHFGGHGIVICGYNPAAAEVLIADRDLELHPVPLADLEKARDSKFQPFPPKNKWFSFDFSARRLPTATDVRQAIAAQAGLMLNPPISNIGVKGIRTAAKLIPQWGRVMDAEALRWAMFNVAILNSRDGGSGGGAFRYMFGRFLHEAAGIAGEPRLAECAVEFKGIGDDWEKLVAWLRQTSAEPQAAARLGECAAPLSALADREEAAWQQLDSVVKG